MKELNEHATYNYFLFWERCEMNIQNNQERKFVDLTYEQAVKKFSDTVTRLCVMRCGNTEDVKDCYQNVFLKLFVSKVEFESYEHIKAWLIQVTLNECVDLHKQYWKKNVLLSNDATILEMFGLQANEKDHSDSTLEAVMTLPGKYRQVIYLYYYEEYRTHEIAQILSIKESTIKSQLARGRKVLKNKLGGYNNEEIFA